MDARYETTLLALFSQRLKQQGNQKAISYKRGGQYVSLTWNELAAQANRIASALIDCGVEPGDRVIQVSENRIEWIIVDLAIQTAQAVHVPVHAPLTGEQIAYQILNSEAKVVILSGDEQAKKLSSVSGQLPDPLIYISFDECSESIGNRQIRLLNDILSELTESVSAEIHQQAIESLKPDSLATILYTSGTTGEPKGVMLNQRNLVSNTLATLEVFQVEEDDVRLCFLPLSHIFARTCDLYTWIATGSQLALAEDRETVIADCQEIHPTLLSGVPYFFDKIFRVLTDMGKADSPGAVSGLLGGKIRVCCSGGAALPPHVFEFFQRQEVPLLQGYGLTESSPVITVTTLDNAKPGTSGIPITDVEVKIAADGEILARGPNIMLGYWKNQQATDEIVKDGWLYTGDLGEIDEDGLLKITGRKKELIVTAGGKNIAPVLLESLLTEDPLILQAVVIGDGQKYLSALIVPDLSNLKSELQTEDQSLPDDAEILQDSRVLEMIQQRIEERLSVVSHYEQVRKFTLLNRAFSVEEGEMTPKLSLRRGVIQKHYSKEIDLMHQ